ncbi:MAG TPA: chloride channel protein [Acidimicrobiales bacterium]|nr:chloride channel protein [Acidimicrobiales bacterium]
MTDVEGAAAPASPSPPASPPDPAELLRSRSYLVALVFGALLGVPVSGIAYFFLKAINDAQTLVFTTLPRDIGFAGAPVWWPLIPLGACGLIVAASIRYLPGTGGHRPTAGFAPGGTVAPKDLIGVAVAAFATLGLGAVLGPEAPLIAIGGGLSVWAVRLLKRDAPAQAAVVIGAAGSFAAIAAILGSPLVGAFLLMEAAGLAGPLLGVILVPGLLAAGVGSLIFVGLYRWTGFGHFTLAIPNIPPFSVPDGSEFLWAMGIGLGAALVGTVLRRLALLIAPFIERRALLLTPMAGLAIAACAIAYAEASGRPPTDVLFSGETALAPLVQQAATWSTGALLLLVVFKGLAYGVSLSGFRGGPTFPAMLIGAAGGIALSRLPGLPMIAAVAMGIGAMTTAVLRLPLTAVLLASIIVAHDAASLMPLVIVAVVVSYVATARLGGPKAESPESPDPPAERAGPPARA